VNVGYVRSILVVLREIRGELREPFLAGRGLKFVVDDC